MTFDAAPGYLSADDCRLADLIDLVSRKTDLADYPYANTVEQNVLIYDGRGCGSSFPARRAGRRLKPNWPAPCSAVPAWSRQQLETELGTWSARRQTRRYTYSTKEIR